MTTPHKAILVTGASGFLGVRMLQKLYSGSRASVTGVSRHPLPNSGLLPCPELEPAADWRHLVNGVTAVVHCAARVHVMTDQATDPLHAYHRANTNGTLTLALQAAEAGVRRFIFLSSVKVLGEETALDSTFQADSPPNPVDPYAISKREAEDGLKAIAAQTGMEVVIIRPPLVYGPGVKGNFATMMRWVAKGVPLPLGAIRHNRRSLVALDNLVDLIVLCIDHPRAANETFLAGDGEDLSTTELLERLAHAMGRPSRLLPVPAWMLEAAATVGGKREVVRRLCGSLRVDIAKTQAMLGWTPPMTVDQGLRDAVRGL